MACVPMLESTLPHQIATLPGHAKTTTDQRESADQNLIHLIQIEEVQDSQRQIQHNTNWPD